MRDGKSTFTRWSQGVSARFRGVQRLGAAGGLGVPEAVAAAFVLGADFVLTGSINQCTAECGTSERVKDMLQQALRQTVPQDMLREDLEDLVAWLGEVVRQVQPEEARAWAAAWPISGPAGAAIRPTGGGVGFSAGFGATLATALAGWFCSPMCRPFSSTYAGL